ncbi:MAG: arsenical pump membrane protein-domain-containing protein [Benniella sp.]|nr:MAG: arsenical pump membrane protein-domain-containing protein [Benniella sp.]
MESNRSLDVHSWLVVVTFMAVIALVIHPIRIPLPIPSSSPSHSSSQDTLSAVGTPAQETPAGPGTSNNGVHGKKRKYSYPYHFTLDIATAPVLGVLLLWAIGSITVDSVRDGIVGNPANGVEPYAVMILFFSLAYICISLDLTGVLQYAAFWISKRGGGGGQRIFLYFFLFSNVMSGLTSNDVVILTMTPFLVYFAHAVDLATPIAFLMAEIQTANIASMALYIGNLTNVVACQAYKISFLEYSAWMLLPCFAAIAACYIMLRINFRHEKYIPKHLPTPEVDPRSCLVDPFGAIFGLSVLALSLICLIGTSFAHVSVWIVTGPFAVLTLVRDIWYDYQGQFKGVHGPQVSTTGDDDHDNDNGNGNGRSSGDAKDQDPTIADMRRSHASGGAESRVEQGLPEIAIPSPSIVQPVTILEPSDDDNSSWIGESVPVSNKSSSSSIKEEEKMTVMMQDHQDSNNSNTNHSGVTTVSMDERQGHLSAPSLKATETTTGHHHGGGSSKQQGGRRRGGRRSGRERWIGRFERRWPLMYNIAIRMPWAIVPFTFSMFIIVEGLSHSGWIAIFATWATRLIPNYVAATYAIGFLSVVLCNLFNNVPMTILVARILQHPNFVNSPLATPDVVKGCLFALIVGSNLGACTTLISSLAGLMWDSVLRSKNSGVGFWNFFKWNMGVMPVVIFVALSVVVVEVKVIYN